MSDDAVELVGSEKVLTGMTYIVNQENTNETLDLRKIEAELLNDKSLMQHSNTGELFAKELDKIKMEMKSIMDEHSNMSRGGDLDGDYKDIYNVIDDKSSPIDDGIINFDKPPVSTTRQIPSSTNYYDSKPTLPSYSSYNNASKFTGSSSNNKEYSRFIGTDDEYSNRTTEEIKNRKIHSVMNKLGGDGSNVGDGNLDLYDDDENDRKMMLIESIESYLEALSDEGINIEKYSNKIPDENSDIIYIERFHRFIERKYNRLTNSSFAEDAILMGALGLEEIFDGKTSYFNGRFKPNLKGWNQVVKTKLRRNKHNTSAIVSNIVDTYQPHPLLMLLINLVPSMIFYSHTNQLESSDSRKTKVSNDEISNAIHNLRNMDD